MLKSLKVLEKQIGGQNNNEDEVFRFNKMLQVDVIDSGLGIDEER